MKAYRGACTLKDWDNTTACPTQWCNNVITDVWSNIWKCPPVNGGFQWWCGNETETTACQEGISASFLSYTAGKVLGFPPLTSSSSIFTQNPSNAVTTISTISGGPNSSPIAAVQTQQQSTPAPTAESPTPDQNQNHSISLPIAIGVSIGVPLCLAVIGLFAFLFWREMTRQRQVRPRLARQISVHENADRSATATIAGPWPELSAHEIRRELDT